MVGPNISQEQGRENISSHSECASFNVLPNSNMQVRLRLWSHVNDFHLSQCNMSFRSHIWLPNLVRHCVSQWKHRLPLNSSRLPSFVFFHSFYSILSAGWSWDGFVVYGRALHTRWWYLFDRPSDYSAWPNLAHLIVSPRREGLRLASHPATPDAGAAL